MNGKNFYGFFLLPLRFRGFAPRKKQFYDQLPPPGAAAARPWRLLQNTEVFPPDPVKRNIEALPIDGNLKVDGRLNEDYWALARPAADFVQVEPLQGEPAGQQTEIRVLYNRQYLYFGVFSRDSLGKKALRAIDFKRDFDPRQHDLVSLSFDCFRDGRNAMVVSPEKASNFFTVN